MKFLKLIMITLALCSVGILSLSCPGSDMETAPEQQVATVQLGDLTVDIMASGNLALSRVEDLAFDIPGRAGEITVEEILVEVGDSVEEGQLLAKLDTSEWDDMLVNLERDLLQAEIDLKNAELSLDKAEAETVTLITGDIVFSTNFDDDEIDILELRLELAEAKLEDAQKALAEALEKSPEIIAPFDGFITRVNVEGGDEVLPGTVAVQLATTMHSVSILWAWSRMTINTPLMGATAFHLFTTYPLEPGWVVRHRRIQLLPYAAAFLLIAAGLLEGPLGLERGASGPESRCTMSSGNEQPTYVPVRCSCSGEMTAVKHHNVTRFTTEKAVYDCGRCGRRWLVVRRAQTVRTDTMPKQVLS